MTRRRTLPLGKGQLEARLLLVDDPYLGLRNYTNNLLRHGFTQSGIDRPGSDTLIDALVAHGSPEAVYAKLEEHFSAGANHVGIQVLSEDLSASPIGAFRTLAEHRVCGPSTS